jgi:hypothetical protein
LNTHFRKDDTCFKKLLWKLLLLTIFIQTLKKLKIEEFEGRNATWKSKKNDFFQYIEKITIREMIGGVWFP